MLLRPNKDSRAGFFRPIQRKSKKEDKWVSGLRLSRTGAKSGRMANLIRSGQIRHAAFYSHYMQNDLYSVFIIILKWFTKTDVKNRNKNGP